MTTSTSDHGLISGLGRVTVLVDDQQVACDWYRDVLGFAVLHDEVIDGFRYLHLGVPRQPDVGLWLLPAHGDSGDRVGRQTGGEPLLVLYTTDLDRVLAHVSSRDVETWDRRDDGDHRSVHLRDVCGNVVVVAEMTD